MQQKEQKKGNKKKNYKEAITRKGTPLELDNGMKKRRINYFR
jgi:hypothetical protein